MRIARAAATGSAVVAFLVSIGLAQTPARPNFTGTWVMDPAKSDLGEMPPTTSHVLTIVHKEPNITIDREVDGRKDSAPLRTDGVETTFKSECCGDLKTTGRWEGTTLMRRVGNESITQNDTWTLSADGKTLTIQRQVEQADGTLKLKMVFNKKE
jgi:hypothetical protein